MGMETGAMGSRDRSRSPPGGSGLDEEQTAKWMTAISSDWHLLGEAPMGFRSQPDLICEAMRNSEGYALQYASEVLRGDREYVLGAVQEIGTGVLEHASTELRANREFMMEVVDYCPPGEVIQYVSPELRDELLSDKGFVIEALQQSGGEVLEHVSLELRGDREFILEVSKLCEPQEALHYATDLVRQDLSADKTFIFDLVRDHGAEVLEMAHPLLLGDRDFMLSVPGPPGEVLQYATDELRNFIFADREWVMAQVQEVGAEVLEFASEELRRDQAFMAEAARYCSPGEVMQYALNGVHATSGDSSVVDQSLAVAAVADPAFAKARPKPPLTPPPFKGAPLQNKAASPAAPLQFKASPPLTQVKQAPPPPPPPQQLPWRQTAPSTDFITTLPQSIPQQPPLPQYTLPPLGQSVPLSLPAPGQALLASGFNSTMAHPLGMPPAGQALVQQMPQPMMMQQVGIGGAPQYVANSFVPQIGQPLVGQTMPQYIVSNSFVPSVPQQFGVPPQFVQQPGQPQPVLLGSVPQYAQLGSVQLSAPIEIKPEPAPEVDAAYGTTDIYMELGTDPVSVGEAPTTAPTEFFGDLFSMVAAGDESLGDEVYISDDEGLEPAEPAEPAEPTELEELVEAPGEDPASVLEAIAKDGAAALEAASEELRGDREFMVSAASFCGLEEALKHATEQLRSELYKDFDFMLKAAHEVGSRMLKFASPELRGDREFMLQVAACCPPREALQYASDKLLKELCGDHEFMLKAVQQVGSTVLAHASSELRGNRAFMLEAAGCRPPGEALKFASKKLLRTLHADREYMLKAVKEVGVGELEKASADLKKDRKFILAAGVGGKLVEALKFAAEELRVTLYKDRTFMLKAVKDVGAAMLENASTELRSDFGFMLEVAALCPPGEAMRYASEELRAMLDEDDDDDPDAT